MSSESGYGKLGTPDGKGSGEVKVLLTESDDRTRAAAEVVLEDLGVAVISARSATRALDLCNSAQFRFDVLVVGPSLFDGGLESFLGRALSVQKTLRVLALTAGNPHHAGGPTMTPLAVCWSLERLGCAYSLLDAPWTGPRLRQCLQELLARPCVPVAFEHVANGSEDDRFPVGTQCPSPVRTKLKL
jgi:hypothetical protein